MLCYRSWPEKTHITVSFYYLATLTTNEREGLKRGGQCRQWVGEQLYRHLVVVAWHVCSRKSSAERGCDEGVKRQAGREWQATAFFYSLGHFSLAAHFAARPRAKEQSAPLTITQSVTADKSACSALE